MSHAALHSARPARSAEATRVATTQRWAIGVLAPSTVALLAYTAVLVAMSGTSAPLGNAPADPAPNFGDVLVVARLAAPALLVGWCTGLATSAVLAGGATLGPRTAGLVAGAVGTTAGAALLTFAGLR